MEGSAVDFSALRNTNPYQGALDPISSAIQWTLEQKAKREAQDKQLTFQREQEARKAAAENQRLGIEDRRLVGRQAVAEADRQAATDNEIRKDVGRGDMASAQRKAQNYTYFDPETGQVMHGRPFAIKSGVGPGETAPTIPEAPVAPNAVPEQGPRIEGQDLENAAIIRAQQEQTQQPQAEGEGIQVNGQGTLAKFKQMQDEANRFAGTQGVGPEMDKFKSAQDQYGLQKAAYSDYQRRAANPTVSIGGVDTTPDEIRYGEARKNSEDFKSLSQPLTAEYAAAHQAGDPLMLASAERKLAKYNELAPQVEKGALTVAQAAAQVNSAGSAEAGIMGKLGSQREHDVTSGEYGLERQRIANQRPQAPGQNARLDLSERKEKSANLRKDVKSTVERFNAKTTQEAAQEFPNIVKMLDSGNGKLQEQALITMMRLAQKDNRFSDADAKMAMKTGAGWLDQAESWLSRGATGAIGPGVIDHAREAAKHLNGFYQQKQAAMNDAMQSFVNQPDYYDPKEAGQLLQREMPGFSPGGQKNPATQTGGKPKKSIQDLIKEASQ